MGLSTLDYVLVGFIVLVTLGGWRRGLIVTVFSILGSIAGAIIANQNQPQPVVVQREQVIVPQPQTVCTAWKEILQPDGQIYRERNCYQR